MNPASARVVAFDFDGTLTRGDTLLRAARPLLGHMLGRTPNDVAKEALLAATLGGRAAQEVRAAAERFATTIDARLRPEARPLLAHHRAAGDRLLLVSASLDWYLAPWAARAGFEACLSSRLEVDARGRVTGRLAGGNCHGEEKARRLREHLGERRVDVAYGDTRGDLPMLALADESYYRGAPWRGPR